uniref:Uncharacterized protein n=1 Tax=Varanus komodoensis TaxID=61221 RepID=A0A8D2KYF6_VARKO
TGRGGFNLIPHIHPTQNPISCTLLVCYQQLSRKEKEEDGTEGAKGAHPPALPVLASRVCMQCLANDSTSPASRGGCAQTHTMEQKSCLFKNIALSRISVWM